MNPTEQTPQPEQPYQPSTPPAPAVNEPSSFADISQPPTTAPIAPTQTPLATSSESAAPAADAQPNAPVFTQSVTSSIPASVKKSRLPLTVSIITAAIIIIASGIIAYFLLYVPSLTHISRSDLVTETSNEIATSYLRAKQWKGATGKANSIAFEDASSKIIVSKGSSVSKGLRALSDQKIKEFRDYVVKASPANEMSKKAQDVLGCSDMTGVTTQPLVIKNSHSVGVFTVNGTCTKDGKPYKATYNGYVGDDGYARSLYIMSLDTVWKQNEDTFSAILNSVDQP